MREFEYYKGREQTYVKHFFLEKYIERLAYNILSFRNKIVYVDGFSGPWKNSDDNLTDTSFYIASEQLKKITSGFSSKALASCLFIEKNPAAFEELQRFCSQLQAISATAICAAFEDAIDQVIKYVANDFSFVFIDPTGWTGFPLKKISPILKLRGETMINFMFDHVNRFLLDSRPENARALNELFGDESWQDDFHNAVMRLGNREEAILAVYSDRLRTAAEYTGMPKPYVSSVKIKNPNKERTYFHLVYVTRSWKGLVEFREVEKRTLFRQQEIRNFLRLASHTERMGQDDLFSGSSDPVLVENPLFSEKANNIELAKGRVKQLISGEKMSVKELCAEVLQIPMVWKADLFSILRALRISKEIRIKNGAEEVSAPNINSIIERI